MHMDPEISELKEAIAELKEVTHDTNRMMHKMRRSQRWHTIFQIVWWLTILGVTGAAYYYYVQPYVERAIQTYTQVQDSAQRASTWQQQAQEFLSNYFNQNPTTQ